MTRSPRTKPITGDSDQRDEHFRDDSIDLPRADASGDERCSEQPTDECMARRRRDAQLPGDEVPQSPRPTSAAAITVWDSTSGSMIPPLIVTATFVPTSAPAKLAAELIAIAQPGAQRARTDRGRDRVRGVVKAVDVVEDDRQADHRQQDRRHAVPKVRSTTIRSITFATSSQESIVSSRMEYTSFHLMISTASLPLVNRSAIARRTMRSPSFSSRWTSIQCGATPLKPLSFWRPRTSSSHCWTMIAACDAAVGVGSSILYRMQVSATSSM